MKENHNIENFFRKRLDLQEFTFREADWQLLEQRLNATGHGNSGSTFQGGHSTIIILIVAVSVTLTFLLGWFARALFEKESNDASLNNIKPENEKVTYVPTEDKKPAATTKIKKHLLPVLNASGAGQNKENTERYISSENNSNTSKTNNKVSPVWVEGNSPKKITEPVQSNDHMPDRIEPEKVSVNAGTDLSEEGEANSVRQDEISFSAGLARKLPADPGKLIENRIELPGSLSAPDIRYSESLPQSPADDR